MYSSISQRIAISAWAGSSRIARICSPMRVVPGSRTSSASRPSAASRCSNSAPGCSCRHLQCRRGRGKDLNEPREEAPGMNAACSWSDPFCGMGLQPINQQHWKPIPHTAWKARYRLPIPTNRIAAAIGSTVHGSKTTCHLNARTNCRGPILGVPHAGSILPQYIIPTLTAFPFPSYIPPMDLAMAELLKRFHDQFGGEARPVIACMSSAHGPGEPDRRAHRLQRGLCFPDGHRAGSAARVPGAR